MIRPAAIALMLLPAVAMALLPPANVHVSFVRGTGGGPPQVEPEFVGVGTCVTEESTLVNTATSTISDVQAGDLIVTLVQRDTMGQLAEVSAGATALSQVAFADAGQGGFGLAVYTGLAAAEAPSMEVTASFSGSAAWASMVTAVFRGVASATPTQAACNTAECVGLTGPTVTRSAQAITTNARSLIIGAGTDWNEYNTHAPANGYTRHFNNTFNAIGCDKSVQWVYSKVQDAGSFGGAENFATASDDSYLSVVMAFE
jgi:hypothetical protein